MPGAPISNIAMISPLFESVPPKLYGGTERVIYNLCRGLKDAGVKVTLFASGDSGEAPAELVPVVPEAFRLMKKAPTDLNPYYLRMLSQVAARASEFDVIHNHHDYWMLPLSEMTTTPVLTTMHGRLDLPDIPAAFMSYPKASFISISDAQRGPLALLNWARTIYHGIDLNDFKFYPEPGKYLAFLGRIDDHKRPDLAIAIAKKAGIPLKIAAKIEGKESQQFYDAHVKRHVDGKFIEYVGEISEKEKCEFLGNAVGLAFPIDWPEPFGLVMIESLACGTPVLARPCGSVLEILRDGVTGFVHSDINVLAQNAVKLASMDRKKMRSWVETRFSIQRMTEDYINVYRHLSESQSYRQQARPRATTHRRDFLYPVERSSH